MANISVYIESLATFNSPATARQVYEKAREMFGDRVVGDQASCRQSLDRYVLRGKAEKKGKGLYLISINYVDPIANLTTENRVLKTENERLRQRIRELEASA